MINLVNDIQEIKKLLIQAAEGNDDTFNTFINMYRSMMKKFARLYVNANDIEDVVQNVCMKLLQYRERLAEVDNIENWLFYVVRNSCYDELRKSKDSNISYEYNHDYIDSMYAEDDILNKYITRESSRMISQCIDELSDGLKIPVKLYYIEKLSIDDIAKVMNINYSTVKWRLHVARLKLKTKILKGENWYE